MRISLLIACILMLAACANEAAEEKNQYQPPVMEDVVDYYPSGLKKVEGQLRNDQPHGKWVYYYENGFKWSEGVFNKGERVGKSIIYYENGKIKMTGQYEKNIKVGVWRVYEDDGTFVDQIDLDSTLTRKDSIALELLPAVDGK